MITTATVAFIVDIWRICSVFIPSMVISGRAADVDQSSGAPRFLPGAGRLLSELPSSYEIGSLVTGAISKRLLHISPRETSSWMISFPLTDYRLSQHSDCRVIPISVPAASNNKGCSLSCYTERSLALHHLLRPRGTAGMVGPQVDNCGEFDFFGKSRIISSELRLSSSLIAKVSVEEFQ